MAIVKTISPKIKTQSHLTEAINYITQDEKASDIFYYRCNNHNSAAKLANEFELMRISANQNKGIIASHICQSFSPQDNISPEKAHIIGIETIKKCFPDFQVVLATHNDRDHIHNHFIINSASFVDNKKFLDNMTTLNQIRKTSDELCYKNNLSVIEKDNVTKYSPLDQATLNAAKSGRSWKFNLVQELDKALDVCKTKNEFINYFLNCNYDIRFTSKNITFKKQGEQKGIRADTLAKQFGLKYSKHSIEKKLNISSSNEKPKQPQNQQEEKQKYQLPNYDYYNQQAAINWNRYEKNYGNLIKIKNKQFTNTVVFSKNPLLFSLRLFRYILTRLYKKSTPKYTVKGYDSHFKVKSTNNYKFGKRTICNISYSTIVNTPGEAVQIKLYAWQISKLLNNNILLSSKLDFKTGTAIVTLKKSDLARVDNILNVPKGSFEEQATMIRNRKIMSELKKKNPKLSYLLVSHEQAQALKEHCVLFASYKKGEKINIAFSTEDKEKVLNVLYPNRAEETVNKETFFKRNSAINRKLKKISKETGEKLCYKIVLSNQYKALRNTTLEFAVFRTDDGKYNVVFLESQKASIEKALKGFAPTNNSINQNMKINRKV